METNILLLTLLIIPFFLGKTSSYRHGLFLGLFISITFLCKNNILLLVVPVSCAFFLYVIKRKTVSTHFAPHSPSFLPLLLVFLGAMSMVFAFNPVTTFTISKGALGLTNFGLIAGPIYFGAKIDERGVLYPSILLCLFSEIAMLFLFKADNIMPIYLIGKTLFAFCQSGFFVVFPRIISLLFGDSTFPKYYIPISIWVFSFMTLSKSLGINALKNIDQLYGLLSALVILGTIGALFIFLAWKKRLFLVIDYPNKM